MKKDLDRLMTDYGIDALYAEGSSHSDPSLFYLLDGIGINGRYIKRRGRPACIVHKSIEREEAAKTGLRLLDMSQLDLRAIVEKRRDPAVTNAMVTSLLFERFKVSGSVACYGLAPLANAYHYLNALRRLNRKLVIFNTVGQDLIARARETKDAQEVRRIRQAGLGVIGGFDAVIKTVRKMKTRKNRIYRGRNDVLTIGDLKTMLKEHLFRSGLVNSAGLIVAQGRDAGVPHNSGLDRQPVELGRTIVFDIFPQEIGGGYFFDFTRTVCFGYAPERLRLIYATVKEAQDRIFGWLKVGERTIEIEKKLCRFFEDHGHPTMLTNRRTQNGYCHTLGHGLGLNVHESPTFGLLKINHDIVKPGAVFTVEPGLYYPDRGFGVRLEDVAYVDPRGKIANLTSYRRELVVEM